VTSLVEEAGFAGAEIAIDGTIEGLVVHHACSAGTPAADPELRRDTAVYIRGIEIGTITAHYDSAEDAAGANDNGSGSAAVLELARLLKDAPLKDKRLRLVLFVNEEPPWFQTKDMGSLVYAKELKRRNENVISAMSLETIGMYSDEEGSQQYPAVLGSLYPKQGNFIAFVGNVSSAALVRRSVASFRRTVSFPAEGAAAPAGITGVSWSDQWSFWQQGYPAVMVTDTAPFPSLILLLAFTEAPSPMAVALVRPSTETSA